MLGKKHLPIFSHRPVIFYPLPALRPNAALGKNRPACAGMPVNREQMSMEQSQTVDNEVYTVGDKVSYQQAIDIFVQSRFANPDWHQQLAKMSPAAVARARHVDEDGRVVRAGCEEHVNAAVPVGSRAAAPAGSAERSRGDVSGGNSAEHMASMPCNVLQPSRNLHGYTLRTQSGFRQMNPDSPAPSPP